MSKVGLLHVALQSDDQNTSGQFLPSPSVETVAAFAKGKGMLGS
jgi:hypothetical protein